MSEFIFEDRGTDFNVSGTCEVFEAGIFDPTSLIKTSETWRVRVKLQTEGTLNAMIGGTWRVRVRLESLGNNPDYDLPAADVLVPLAPSVAPNLYLPFLTEIVTPPFTIEAGAYKLVTTITYLNLVGTPGPIAGYCEGGILQFYVSVP